MIAYLVSGLGIMVMMACVIGAWHWTFQANARQPPLLMLFAGQFIVTWSAIAPASWCWTWWWNVVTATGLMLLLGGLARLTWFMWLRNGSFGD